MEEDEPIENPLIQSCKCSGTMKYIHLNCLKQWIGVQSFQKIDSNEDYCIYLIHKIQCELCHTLFPDIIKHQGRSYEITDFNKEYSNYMIIEALTLDKFKNKYLYVVNLDINREIKIGRGHETNLLLSDISVSRLHCKITVKKKGLFIEDFDSKFGTLILMQNPIFKLNSEIPLNIQIGRTFMRLKIKKPFKLFNCCDDTEKVDDDFYHAQNAKYIKNNADEKKIVKIDANVDDDDEEEDIDYDSSSKRSFDPKKIIKMNSNENNENNIEHDDNDLNNEKNIDIIGLNIKKVAADREYNVVETGNNIMTTGNNVNSNGNVNNNNNVNFDENNSGVNRPIAINIRNNNNGNNNGNNNDNINNENNDNEPNSNNRLAYRAQQTRLINL